MKMNRPKGKTATILRIAGAERKGWLRPTARRKRNQFQREMSTAHKKALRSVGQTTPGAFGIRQNHKSAQAWNLATPLVEVLNESAGMAIGPGLDLQKSSLAISKFRRTAPATHDCPLRDIFRRTEGRSPNGLHGSKPRVVDRKPGRSHGQSPRRCGIFGKESSFLFLRPIIHD